MIGATSIQWLLLCHIASAMTLIAGLITVVLTSLASQHTAQSAHVPLLRAIAFRANLILVIPPFVLVHVFGAMLADRLYTADEPRWLGASFAITTIATIVALAMLALQFWVLRRVRTGQLGGWQPALATYLSPVLLVAMVTVLFLMAGTPAG
jgi:hypothetical protein